MNKRLSLYFCISMVSLVAQAQWSQKDSLNLLRILGNDGEIKLNKNVIKEIDFGTFAGSQQIDESKPALNFDVTLPKVSPEKKEIRLTLRPYTANTKYNYDPIYHKKIIIKTDTWRSDKFRHLTTSLIPSNWAKTPFDPGIRKSVEQIEATGLRYNPLAGRANNLAVGSWEGSGGGFQGDLMAPFTKDFWDKKGRKRRLRTLEVLSNYGDSIVVSLNEEIKKAIDPL